MSYQASVTERWTAVPVSGRTRLSMRAALALWMVLAGGVWVGLAGVLSVMAA